MKRTHVRCSTGNVNYFLNGECYHFCTIENILFSRADKNQCTSRFRLQHLTDVTLKAFCFANRMKDNLDVLCAWRALQYTSCVKGLKSIMLSNKSRNSNTINKAFTKNDTCRS